MFRSPTSRGAPLGTTVAQLLARTGLGAGTVITTVMTLGAPVAGCSGADERLDFNEDGFEGATSRAGAEQALDDVTPYAHVDVRITERVDSANSEVLAHFVYSSERRYADSIASLNRPDRALPAPGRCVVTDTSGARARIEPSALLEAGAVTLRAVPLDPVTQQTMAANSVEVSLAPRAFPGVSGLSPGVVYTSRDRQPLLPSFASYEVDVQGGVDVPSLKLTAIAPSQLNNVTVAGTPIRLVTDLAWGQPVDITWDVPANNGANNGEPDLVYVDVTSKQAGQGLLRCAYWDAAGTGTLPWTDTLARGLANNSQATLNLHRHRRVTSLRPEAGQPLGELRFDFELTRDVNFTTAVPSP